VRHRAVVPAPRESIARLAARQDAVVTTAQCLDLGADPDWIARQATTDRWQRTSRGVYVVHSGPLPWRTRARAALVRAGEGAALSHRAAAHLHGFEEMPPAVIDVTIPPVRRVRSTPDVRVHRSVGRLLDRRSGLVVVSRGDAALDLFELARSEDAAIGSLCAATRGRVSADAILVALSRRPSTRRRALVLEMLSAVCTGIESPLEHRYLRDVERRHGLPHARLQHRQVVDGRWIRADGIYDGLGVRRELDGELAHPGGSTDADVWRDNAVRIAHDEITVRYRWWHVAGTPCLTAVQVVAALRSRGWRGTPHPCGPGCPVR
jgi:hypothetical protein